MKIHLNRTSTPESVRAAVHCHCSSYAAREDFLTNEIEFKADLLASNSNTEYSYSYSYEYCSASL